MTQDFEKSVKSKLHNIALEKRIDSTLLWQNLILERFLIRVAKSPYAAHFVLKGGFLLAQYIPIERHTQDIDFLAHDLPNDLTKIEQILKEIAAFPLSDGFEFFDLKMLPLEHIHMKYMGARALFRVCFGRARFKLKIDLGFGDRVIPRLKTIGLTRSKNGALFESKVEISCYPIEFIFAEKLETLVYRGSANSRMKDFHDIFAILQSNELDRSKSLEITHSVFKHRHTGFNFPIRLPSDEIQRLQGFWDVYYRGLVDGVLVPDRIESVIEQVNEWYADAASSR